jgi:hypothetical protein
MSALDQVIICQRDLLTALDARDVVALESAAAALAVAVSLAKAEGPAEHDLNARDQIDYSLKQNEAARIRVNYLADWNRQKIDRLAELRGLPAPYPKRRSEF